jgi:hypothetical protein
VVLDRKGERFAEVFEENQRFLLQAITPSRTTDRHRNPGFDPPYEQGDGLHHRYERRAA